ncbi:cysteine-rich receptor-like protein kinase [Tanacetum coccineum]|uniref:Cysteine-rich receptor-like protein kinase n=1 Tax=Tanacetum coccineum TaxID=301880 RepID=A0ABQ4WL70_9ASTR
MPCSYDRTGMWDRRVSTGKCNHSIGNEMISIFIMAEEEIDNLTIKQYLALTRGNQAPGVVKPEIRAAKRWVDRLPPGTVDSWDLLKKAFIQRHCPPSRTAKQLEEIHNFKQEGDETLYQA